MSEPVRVLCDYRSLFEDSPISLWLEDFSGIKACVEHLQASGVTDFRTYLLEHPEVVRHCMSLVKIVDVNRRTLELYKAARKEDLLGNLSRVASEDVFDAHRQSILAIAEGKMLHEFEATNRALTGEDLQISLRWSVMPGYEQTFSRVIVSIIDITARKQAEQALHENQRMLTTLMSNLPGMVYRCRNKPDWTMEFVSDGCRQLTGYVPDDLIDNNTVAFGRIIHPDDRQEVWNLVQAALQQRQPYKLRYRITAADKQTKWVWEQGRGVYSPEGQIVALEGFIADITDRNRAEQALVHQKELLQTIFDHIPVMIALLDAQGDFQLVNRHWEQTLGWSLEELRRQDQYAESYPTPDFRRQILRFIRAASADWTDFKMHIRDGRILNTSWAAVRLSDRTCIAIGQDITARKQTEDALRQSEDKYRSLFETMMQGVIYVDGQGYITSANPAAERILGLTLEQMKAEPLHIPRWQMIREDGTPMPGNERPTVQAMATGKCVGPMVVGLVNAQTGQRRWISVNGVPVFKPHEDKPCCAYTTFEDITELKRVQEVMLERTSLRELSHRILSSQEEERRRLSRELHDEAGQALTAIKINTELLTKRIPDSLPAVKRLAQDTTELAAGLISEMRRIAAALRPAVLEDLGLLPTLRWYTKSMEMRYGLQVKLISRGIKGRLEQSFETAVYRIVQEALTNVVRHAQAGHVQVRVACGRKGLDLAISDDGKGMDLASIRRGTGLTGIRERAHLFRGTMTLESQPGKGTTLQIRFPSIPEAASCVKQ